MGYSTHRFLSPVDPNLVCGVCGGVLEDAVATHCGHTFCYLCLHTWLARPSSLLCPLTCPECRTTVPPEAVKPVHSLRNLIRGLEVQCDHVDKGCPHTMKLDLLHAHLAACLHAPVECAGCEEEVSRLDLAEHQLTCAGIAALVQEDDDAEEGEADEVQRGARRRRGSEYYSPAQDLDGGESDSRNLRDNRYYSVPELENNAEGEVDQFNATWRDERETAWSELRESTYSERHDRLQPSKHNAAAPVDVGLLLARVRALESRVEHLLDELQSARIRNRQLERQYERVGAELRHKQRETRQVQDAKFFLDYEVGRTADTVPRLSLLIARHLLHKPSHLLSDDVFQAIRKCYDNFQTRERARTNRPTSHSDLTSARNRISPTRACANNGTCATDFSTLRSTRTSKEEVINDDRHARSRPINRTPHEDAECRLNNSHFRPTGNHRPSTEEFTRSSLPYSPTRGRGADSICSTLYPSNTCTTYEHDLHMLLATAYASNWFSTSQRLSIRSWLSGLASSAVSPPPPLSSSTSTLSRPLPLSWISSSTSSSGASASKTNLSASSLGFSRPGSALFNR